MYIESKMSIGLVCQYLEPKVKRSGDIEYKNISGERSLQYKQYLKNLYSKEYIEEIWGKIKPLSHLSNSKPDMLDGSFSEKRKHSDYVYNIPEYLLRICFSIYPIIFRILLLNF